ncbi:MAG: TIGR04283 family arsenosugar biosynthesis glycosyltransferase [Candidatus Brocadiia bacterium]
MPAADCLIVFTRYPEPGHTKTRLVPALGERGAADLHRRMVERVMAAVGELAARMPLRLHVSYAGGDTARMRQWLGRGACYLLQTGEDLGERMSNALTEAMRRGAQRAVLVGTDCPGIGPDLLADALRRLRQHDVVLGPARDGGYYLVGLRRPVPGLFHGIPWGTDAVLRRTLRRADRLGLSCALVAELEDVDRPDDLHVWQRETGTDAALPAEPAISVIVPALNEERYIADCLRSAAPGRNVGAVVVDGGSEDATADVAQQAGARVLAGPRCRAMQCNLGAEAADGDILLFLHADSLLPPGYDAHVRRALSRPGVSCGAFRLGINGDGAALRFLEWTTALRSTYRGLPYGDQALFLRREVFEQVGGFPDMPIMEDYEFVRRLGCLGRVVTLRPPVLASARRWQRVGVCRTTILNSAIVAAYRLGVSPHRLAAWYGRRGG